MGNNLLKKEKTKSLVDLVNDIHIPYGKIIVSGVYALPLIAGFGHGLLESPEINLRPNYISDIGYENPENIELFNTILAKTATSISSGILALSTGGYSIMMTNSVFDSKIGKLFGANFSTIVSAAFWVGGQIQSRYIYDVGYCVGKAIKTQF
jgi:hypothetical protein